MAPSAHPKLVRHTSGKARLRLNGKDDYGPAFGTGKKPSPEAQAWADELIARWLANGRRLSDVSHAALPDGGDLAIVDGAMDPAGIAGNLLDLRGVPLEGRSQGDHPKLLHTETLGLESSQ